MVSRGLERWLRSKAFDVKTEISEFKSQVLVKTLVNYGDPFVITLSRLSLSEMITRTKQLAKLPDRRVWGSKRDLALIYKMDSHCRRLLGQPLPLHAFIYTHTHAHSHIYIQTPLTNTCTNKTMIWETVKKTGSSVTARTWRAILWEQRERKWSPMCFP